LGGGGGDYIFLSCKSRKADRTSPAVSDAANRLVAWLLQRYLEAR